MLSVLMDSAEDVSTAFERTVNQAEVSTVLSCPIDRKWRQHEQEGSLLKNICQ